MNLSGQLKVLTDDQMQTVHDTACMLLTEKGMVFESDDCVEIFKRHGCKVEGNTVYISKALVEESLTQVPSSFRLDAPNPQRSVIIGEGLVFHGAGGETFMRDYQGGLRTQPTLADFANIQKLYQASTNLDIAGYAPISPHDVPQRTKSLWTVLESFKNSDKPLLSPMEVETIQKKEEIFRLFEIYFGKGWMDEHYATWHIVCPNSPYFFSEFACDGIRMYAEHNQPVCIVSAPMTGITSPVFLLSTLILTIAESHAGLVLAQLVKPGLPVLLSASLTYGYMRTASWECASPDTSLMLAASIQMFKYFYKLPARAQTGVTSSKTIDFQAGMETTQSLLFTALAGVNVTSQSIGALANLMTASLEKIILDDELAGRVRYLLKGMQFSEEQMGVDDLLQAPPSSDFLTNDSTLEHFRDAFAPTVSCWRSTEEWQSTGSQDAEDRAHAIVQQVLEQAPESLLDPEIEKEMLAYIKSIEG